MLGTGPFAVPTFRALLSSHHRVAALVTRPAKAPRDRRGASPAGPMQAVADEHGLPVLAPENVNADEARHDLARFDPDLLVVCDYGQILSPAVLAVARLGGINLHASLLPKYRGAAPINWALYHGETETGATVIHMTPQLDAGPCIAQRATPIGPDETAVELENRLAELGAPLVLRAIDELSGGHATPIPQDPRLACRAPRLKKSDGQIDWTRSAEAIRNQVRAFQPWPRSYSALFRQAAGSPAEPLRVMVDRVGVVDAGSVPETGGAVDHATCPPGTIVVADGAALVVATGSGWLRLETLQPAGKRSMASRDFQHGYHPHPGDRFTAAESFR
jgi:methionyl-tRNA formyltransferase